MYEHATLTREIPHSTPACWTCRERRRPHRLRTEKGATLPRCIYFSLSEPVLGRVTTQIVFNFNVFFISPYSSMHPHEIVVYAAPPTHFQVQYQGRYTQRKLNTGVVAPLPLMDRSEIGSHDQNFPGPYCRLENIDG